MQIVTSTNANPIAPNTNGNSRRIDSTNYPDTDDYRINPTSNLGYAQPSIIQRPNTAQLGDSNTCLTTENLRKFHLCEQQNGAIGINVGINNGVSSGTGVVVGGISSGTNARGLNVGEFLELQSLRNFLASIKGCPMGGGTCPVHSGYKTPTTTGENFSTVTQHSMETANHMQLYHPSVPPHYPNMHYHYPNMHYHYPNMHYHHPNIPYTTHIGAQVYGEPTLIACQPPPHLHEGKHSTRRSGPTEIYGVAYRNWNSEV